MLVEIPYHEIIFLKTDKTMPIESALTGKASEWQ